MGSVGHTVRQGDHVWLSASQPPDLLHSVGLAQTRFCREVVGEIDWRAGHGGGDDEWWGSESRVVSLRSDKNDEVSWCYIVYRRISDEANFSGHSTKMTPVLDPSGGAGHLPVVQPIYTNGRQAIYVLGMATRIRRVCDPHGVQGNA